MSNWDGIEEFVSVLAMGSFTGAAKALNVSTSHISRAISNLENRIEAPVFFRSTRKISLTETGKLLEEQFRNIINERDEALASVSMGANPQGEMRITCSGAIGERFVVPLALKYMKENPKLNITIDLTNRIVDLIAERYDLAIRTGRLNDSRLVSTKVAGRRLILCASPEYLAKNPAPQKIDELANHACIVGVSPIWRFNENGQEITFRPKGRMRCNSGTALLQAVVDGLGICQLPEFYLHQAIEQNKLVTLLNELRPDDEPIWAVYPQRRHLLPKVKGFVELLRAELGPAFRRTNI